MFKEIINKLFGFNSVNTICGIEDDVGYDQYYRRLNTTGFYCLYSSSLNACTTLLVSYSSTNRRLVSVNTTTSLNQNCPSLTSTQYNTTTRRLQTISRSSKCLSGQ